MASLTLTRLRAKVSANLGMTGTASGDEQDLITEWLNEAQEDILLKTHCKVRRASMSLTAGEQEYSLPTQALAVLEVYTTSSSTNYPLERVSLQELVRFRRVSGSSPLRCYAVKGYDYLEVYPAPGSSETLTLYYVPRPTALSTGSDTPDTTAGIPPEWHMLLEYYASWRGAMMDENQTSQFGAIWLGLYEKGLGELRTASHGRGGTRSARARVGRRSYRSTDPSVPR